MALTWASTDVSNHINFIPDEKIYLLNALHEAVLKKITMSNTEQFMCSQWNLSIG